MRGFTRAHTHTHTHTHIHTHTCIRTHRSIRQIATDKHFRLSNHALERLHPDAVEFVALQSEQELFAHLGLEYIPPEERNV